MSIKAIETVYQGYRFRSRLEARWAVIFDALGLNWEYEPEGFVLPDGTWYLPDFYLKDEGWFVEVKPDRPLTDEEKNKVQQLDNIVIDNGDYPSWGCLVTPPIKEDFTKNFEGSWGFWSRLGVHVPTRFHLGDFYHDFTKVNQAILKGKQARFEHGERG